MWTGQGAELYAEKYREKYLKMLEKLVCKKYAMA
jgi:hypothetical protein